ncbi:MAG TPA: sigma-54 dependent transcriptional regulator [Candidatus Angelobacter sp.]|nr:sigma-54 dependent transcriptional regulator [Candidatus Angelobacter sp.]
MRILFAEDEAFGEAVQGFLEVNGFEVSWQESAAAVLKAAEVFTPDLILLDYSLSDGNALELIPQLKAMHPGSATIVLTGRGSIELAVECMQVGADHFLTKPVRLDALLAVIRKVLAAQKDRRAARSARLRMTGVLNPFVGGSRMIKELEEEARRLLTAQSPIFIQGETGAGKGVLARWMHQNGPRADEPFVEMNCAGLSRELLESELFGHEKGAFTGAATAKEGLFEVANRGTIFLDEIGDMDAAIQPKLLKAVEEKRFRRLGETRERQVDIHLISASHADLRGKVAAGTFREDLYYRIAALPLRVPSLKERPADIPPLAELLLESIGTELGRSNLTLAAGTLKQMQLYHWPGNIREMRNVLERAVLLSRTDCLEKLELNLQTETSQAPYAGSLQDAEREEIYRVLQEQSWNVTAAAKLLGISRSGLYTKIKQYALRPGNGQVV